LLSSSASKGLLQPYFLKNDEKYLKMIKGKAFQLNILPGSVSGITFQNTKIL
jgi:hypothetical protein